MKTKNIAKRMAAVVLSIVCIFTMAIGTTFAYDIVEPTEPVATKTSDGVRYLTTTAQRASSEIPLVLGLNIIGGNIFNGALVMAGTEVNDVPDPYIWNLIYMYPGAVKSLNGAFVINDSSIKRTDGTILSQDEYYEPLGSSGQSSDASSALYLSGGADEIYSTAMEQYGGVSFSVYHMIDVYIGINDNAVNQLTFIKNGMDKNSEYYQEGYASYNPLFADVQTGTLTARAYSWSDLGSAIDSYVAAYNSDPAHTDQVSTRYGSVEALCYNIQEFSFGIPYYIRSQIEAGKLQKVKAAWIQSTDDTGTTFTLTNPGENQDLKGDSYSFAGITDWIEGSMTMSDIIAAGADVIIIGSAGYGTGGNSGTGGGQGGGRGGQSGSTLTRAYLLSLMEQVAGVTPENAPVVIDSQNGSVTAGTNGYNFAPTTPLYIPQIVAYLYLDQLKDTEINPVGLFQYALDEFFHIKDSEAANMAEYWIGTKWDAVDSSLNKSPALTNYVYDKAAIEAAIQQGIVYAISNTEDQTTWVKGAFRETEPAYRLAQALKASGQSSFAACITEKDGNYIVSNNGTDEDVTTLVTAYGIDGISAIIESYAAHMDLHAWSPNLAIEGTYGYGLTPELRAADISAAKVTLAKTSMAYTGKALKPAVKSVVVDGVTLTAGTDYTVKYASNTKVGTAKVTITGIGNYTGKATKTFKITQAANSITKVTPASKSYKASTLKKKAQTFKLTAKDKFSAKTTFKLASANAKAKKYIKVASSGKVTVKKGTPKGTYKIKVKVTTAKTANYKTKSVTKTITIKVK